MDKSIVDQVSPSFCAAKWTQVTIDLQHGMNHSCHHPLRHEIPLKELQQDVAALHNTKFKKKQRRKMLKGSRPRECSYCWDIEDADRESFSDRYIKSNDSWSAPYIDAIAKAPWDQNVNPRYLEVFFSNKCNLSCSYCMADVSSSIDEEMKRFGPYPLKDKVMRRHRQYRYKRKDRHEENPYQDAFWRWLPTIYRDLRVLRLTGGEPLLDDNLDRLLDYMITHPHSDLTFSVNTNLSFNQVRRDQFFDKIEHLKRESSITTELYTSLDTYGEQAQYIRAGLHYQQVIANIEAYLQRFPKERLIIMCCFNILSISHFDYFLKEVIRLKEKGQVILDISYLKDPAYLCAKICGPRQLQKLEQTLAVMERGGFSDFEIKKLKRIVLLLRSYKTHAKKASFDKEKRDFKIFIREYDKRKNTSFDQVFKTSLDHFLL